MTKEYDYNIYVSDKVLSLSAYQVEIASNGQKQTRTDNYKTLSIPMTEENKEEIAYLLDSQEWEDNIDDWDEYDAWHGYHYLTDGNSPDMVIKWLDNLPEYEMRVNNG